MKHINQDQQPPEQTTPPTPTLTPIQEGVNEGYESPERIIFREEFEKSLKWVDERIANTNYIMGVIVVVLFVGLLACLFAVFSMFQQAQIANNQLDFKKSIEDETKVVDELKKTVSELNSSIKQINLKLTPTQVSTQ